MSVLSFIEVENFRSIRLLRMQELTDYCPIAGLNSSGKSNLLRALNLFFNGYVDEEREPVYMPWDLSTYLPKGKKKHISVTVGLRLGDHLKVPKQDDFHAAHGISDEIFIKRKWSLGPDQTSTVESLEFGASLDHLVPATGDLAASVQTHIRAVRYVYVPNHARPADLIRDELEPLRATMVARLRSSKVYRDTSVDGLLDELGKVGGRMFGDLADSFARGVPGTALAPELPTDFADLIFEIGLKAITDGEARNPEYEGSGTQAFMLLHTLDLADRTRRSGGFGWVQASIWAIEEPESFLHAGLRAQFSSDLAGYATDPRRQVFATTHQDEFLRVAEWVWIADRTPATTLRRMTAREALEEATRRSISTFRHPLFTFADTPLVVTEGKFDDIHIRAAIAASGIRPRWKLISPAAAFGEDIGGDSLLQYLKYNRQVIASRPVTAPIVVLRDWEATDAKKYDNVLAVHPHSTCLTAPKDLVNPELDESFRGIERYLATDLVTRLVPVEYLGRETLKPDSRFSIKPEGLHKCKPDLANHVRGSGECGPHLVDLVRWLDHQIVELLETVPAADFAADATGGD